MPEATPTTDLGLRDRQSLLVKCLGELIRYATERGYELTLGEAFVQRLRPARNGVFFEDGLHMADSLHYQRLAIDVNLFVNGEYITDSENFVWVDLGGFWESLDPQCAWGGRFKDGNHLSIRYKGKA